MLWNVTCFCFCCVMACGGKVVQSWVCVVFLNLRNTWGYFLVTLTSWSHWQVLQQLCCKYFLESGNCSDNKKSDSACILRCMNLTFKLQVALIFSFFCWGFFSVSVVVVFFIQDPLWFGLVAMKMVMYSAIVMVMLLLRAVGVELVMMMAFSSFRDLQRFPNTRTPIRGKGS